APMGRFRSLAASSLAKIHIHQILQHLLAAAYVGGGFVLLKHVLLKLFKADRAGFDLVAQAGRVAAVTLLDERGELSIRDHLRGDLEAMGKRVHAADVGVEE